MPLWTVQTLNSAVLTTLYFMLFGVGRNILKTTVIHFIYNVTYTIQWILAKYTSWSQPYWLFLAGIDNSLVKS